MDYAEINNARFDLAAYQGRLDIGRFPSIEL